MKKVLSTLSILVLLVVIVLIAQQNIPTKDAMVEQANTNIAQHNNLYVYPVSHATAVLDWDDVILYGDPVGGAEAFNAYPSPDIVFVTDIHGDHLDVETLEAVMTKDTALIAPHAVVDELPESLADRAIVLANGETTTQWDFTFEAIPMYNLPESEDARHPKGRGNGYVIEYDGMRVYFSGDTADIPEMRALQNIDVAFMTMNLPYTMSPENAADAVLEFEPTYVYPYHYRQPDGFADVALFKQLVEAKNPDITVVQLDWYQE